MRAPVNFWAGKADVQIVLTVPGSPLLEVEKEGARVATAKDREAVVEKILQVVDAEKIHYEDSAFATKVRASYCPDRLCGFGPDPADQESLYVKSDDPGAVEKLSSALGDTPGVDFVFPVRPDVL
ncbi:hypothetical protein HS048_07020 [Planomonospora sp. ID91781]|uniref:hypothetical protein n=1 Tax=Planomonospora sp. ID91781 TaxID=2738135 RepID=UPI0018C432E3|nr:hypothetical protein [Planomonospora sp. ID91781]MBG0820484.1 hypothetical protein [Planomonospora sp. ID91781]